ncbi:phosphopantetheine-binding protein [Streptomyces sp. S1A(2023)]
MRRGPDDAAAGQHVLLAERDGWPVPSGQVRAKPGRAAPDLAAPNRPARKPEPETEMPGSVRATAPPALDEEATAYLTGVFSDVLKLAEGELDPHSPLAAYGCDSLVSMEVADRIEADLGAAPRHVPFESTSLNGVVEALLESQSEAFARFAGVRPAAAQAPRAAVPETGPELAQVALAYLARIFSDVLKLAEGELDPHYPLAAYGCDSLVSMEVADRIEADLGPIPRTLAYESTSLSGVVESLLADPAQPLGRLVDRDTPTVPVRRRAAATTATATATATAMTTASAGVVAPAATPPTSVASPAASVTPVPGAPAASDEPIAVVGISGRFPGADSVDAPVGSPARGTASRLRDPRRALGPGRRGKHGPLGRLPEGRGGLRPAGLPYVPA